MKKLTFLIAAILGLSVSLQARDFRLVFGEDVPENVQGILQQRFTQMLSPYGINLSPDATDVFMVDAAVTSRVEIGGGQVAITVDLTASVGEVTQVFSLKGVGADEADAWARAAKQLLPRSREAESFCKKI